MADNYLEFSEVIPKLTTEEEAWLKNQLETVCVFDGEEYPDDRLPENRSSEEADWVGCRALRDMADYDPNNGADAGFQYEFHDSDDADLGRYLWLYSCDWGFVDNVAHLVRKFLGQFRPADCWSMTWSTTCSKPRLGEFGGGGVFVTAEQVLWQNAWEFIEQRRATFNSSGTAASDTSGGSFRQMLQDLLNCCELNLDELEDSTRQMISRAQTLLEVNALDEGCGSCADSHESNTPDPHGTWKCDECGWTTEVSYAGLAEIGTPLCTDCDIEMALLDVKECTRSTSIPACETERKSQQ
jgi:hypothetical protein